MMEILNSGTRGSGKTLYAYNLCLKSRLEGKEVLIHTPYPKQTTDFIDKEDTRRFGRKIGNYQISGKTGGN